MPSGASVPCHQFIAEKTSSCVKEVCLLAEVSSEPILVCFVFTADVKKFVLPTQYILL